MRNIRVLTNDDALLASVRAAAEDLTGWEVVQVDDQATLLSHPPVAGDLLLIDSWCRGENVYEYARRLTGNTKCRTFLVVEHGNQRAQAIARFCGATGVITRPVNRSAMNAIMEEHPGPAAPLPSEGRGQEELDLPEALLVDITSGRPDQDLIHALIDPATGLFNYAFLNYKLDEEYKRARRFETPLTCVMLGFEGQASEEVLRELAGIFLASSRDTDILGRFDESSFLFLLPHTGPDGATVMAHRVSTLAEERGLHDLVGDPLALSIGISHTAGTERKEGLYHAARDAFFAARNDGGGVVLA
ncbi:MAG: diguanylate cyclase [Planctomycetota bacterium]|nr:diguanylate cyclase [Planctomycetota bacterium]